ncbi:MAG: FAD:protein FMN transferase [Planctomycetota bacterium]|nr:FAD:protein FMN transferase [Planctomycetota bacterium]
MGTVSDYLLGEFGGIMDSGDRQVTAAGRCGPAPGGPRRSPDGVGGRQLAAPVSHFPPVLRSAILAAMGGGTLTLQVLFFREMLSVFWGSEAVAGAVLGGWLLLGGIGGAVLWPLAARRLSARIAFPAGLIALAMAGPATIPLIRAIPFAAGHDPGVLLSFWTGAALTLIALAPPGILSGAVFAAAIPWAAGQVAREPGGILPRSGTGMPGGQGAHGSGRDTAPDRQALKDTPGAPDRSCRPNADAAAGPPGTVFEGAVPEGGYAPDGSGGAQIEGPAAVVYFWDNAGSVLGGLGLTAALCLGIPSNFQAAAVAGLCLAAAAGAAFLIGGGLQLRRQPPEPGTHPDDPQYGRAYVQAGPSSPAGVFKPPPDGSPPKRSPGTGRTWLRRAAIPEAAAFAAILNAACAFTPLGRALDETSLALAYPGETILARGETPSGQIVATERLGQRNFYCSGRFLSSSESYAADEELVHLALLHHPDPERVLLIGGLARRWGTLAARHGAREIILLESDPAVASVLLDAGALSGLELEAIGGRDSGSAHDVRAVNRDGDGGGTGTTGNPPAGSTSQGERIPAAPASDKARKQAGGSGSPSHGGAELPSLAQGSCSKVSVVYGDARAFLRNNPDTFDAVILDPGMPATFSQYRLMTAEFFADAAGALRRGGMLAFALPGRRGSQGRAERLMLASVRAALRSVFPDARLIAGEAAGFLFVASGVPLPGADEMRLRWEQLGLRPVTIPPGSIGTTYLGFADRSLAGALDSERGVRPSSDFEPACLGYATAFMLKAASRGTESLWTKLLLDPTPLSGWIPMAAALGAGAVLAFVPWLIAILRNRTRGTAGGPQIGQTMPHATPGASISAADSHAGAPAQALVVISSLPSAFAWQIPAAFLAGASGLALEVLLMNGFQVVRGSLYGEVGAFLAAFMAGAGIGAAACETFLWTCPSLPRRGRKGARVLGCALEVFERAFRRSARGVVSAGPEGSVPGKGIAALGASGAKTGDMEVASGAGLAFLALLAAASGLLLELARAAGEHAGAGILFLANLAAGAAVGWVFAVASRAGAGSRGRESDAAGICASGSNAAGASATEGDGQARGRDRAGIPEGRRDRMVHVSGGIVYGADLAGAAAGAYLCSGLLIPLLGMPRTGIVASLLCVPLAARLLYSACASRAMRKFAVGIGALAFVLLCVVGLRCISSSAGPELPRPPAGRVSPPAERGDDRTAEEKGGERTAGREIGREDARASERTADRIAGRAARRTTGQAAERTADEGSRGISGGDARPEAANRLERISRSLPIMGTMARVSIVVPEGDHKLADRAFEAAFGAMKRVNELMSDYRDDSEVARMRRMRPGESATIHEWTAESLAVSLLMHRLSGGAFDPTIRPVLKLYRFSGREEDLPAGDVLAAAMAKVGLGSLELDPAAHRVRIGEHPVDLDFGAVGKGYANDRAAMALGELRVPGALLAISGEILAVGRKEDGSPWRVGIQHPRDKEAIVAEVEARPGEAISTSGDYEKFFFHKGVRHPHVIDARTGRPVLNGPASVTVLYLPPEDCKPPLDRAGAVADALATSLLILGREEGRKVLDRIPGADAIFLYADDRGDIRAAASAGAMRRARFAAGIAAEELAAGSK